MANRQTLKGLNLCKAVHHGGPLGFLLGFFLLKAFQVGKAFMKLLKDKRGWNVLSNSVDYSVFTPTHVQI